MTWHCLALIRPLDPSTGNRIDVRVTSSNLREITGLDGVRWDPAMIEAPRLSMRLFNGDFQAAVQPGSARLPLALKVLAQTYTGIESWYWAGAEVTIYAGKIGEAWPWQTVFTGTVRTYKGSASKLDLTANVVESTFDVDVLTATYAGTGDAEGSANIKGQPKPLAIGFARNVEPVLINEIDSVYQFSAYGPIEAVNTLYERGSDFGVAAADYADYAALQAASIAPGTWATCLAEGLVRLGAPAYGVITGEVLGHAVGGTTPRLAGAMIKELASISGLAPTALETASLDAMDAAVPYDVNLVLRDNSSFLEASQRLALTCNYQAGISLLGKFFVAGIDLGATPQFTLNAQGRALPQVIESDEEFVSPPYYKTIMGAERSWRVHTFDEIAYYAPLIDLGTYSPTTTYREGNIVTDAGGDRWIYVNPTPSAGNEPADGSIYWEAFGGGGISTTRWPDPVPDNPPLGSLYFDENGRPFRFEGRELFSGTNQLFSGIEPLLGGGWVLVQDKSLADAIDALLSVDDDGVLTIGEKVRIVIPEDSRLEAQYQGVLTQSTAIGVAIVDLTNARDAWIALRDGLDPAWNDISQDTPIARGDWDSILETYRTELGNAQARLVEPASVLIIPPGDVAIKLNTDGTVKSGEYPLTISASVKRGSVDIKTSDDVSYAIATSGITASVDNTPASGTKGDITATAGTSGTISLTVTVNGVAFGPYVITFTGAPETSASFSANTYSFEIRQPNGDILLFQGGTDTVAANTKESYNFPVPYSVAPNVVVSGNPDDTSREGNAGLVGNPTTTGFEANNSTAVVITLNWQAVGKK